MRSNFRHIDNNLMLALWLMLKANQEGKTVVRLNNSFLKTLFDQLRVSDKQLDMFREDTQHIFPFQQARFIQSKTVLDLCAHEPPESYHRAIRTFTKVPSIEEMESDLGVQWKRTVIEDFDMRSDAPPYVT